MAAPPGVADSHRSAASRPLPVGHLVAGRYEIAAVIGEGATGVVYLAHRRDPPSSARASSPRSDEPATTSDEPATTSDEPATVALKVVHRHLFADGQIAGRFRREAKILKRLRGPHLVPLLDFIEEDDLRILVLEHVDGVTLEARLADGHPLAIAEAVGVALQVCDALDEAHAAGVVHRDLKPANVMLEAAAPGETPRVRVVDFGLAKVVHGEAMTTGLTEQDMIFGTPDYMAPEQVRGDEVDLRCDIYAVGVVLYEMLVGSAPFCGRMPIAIMTAQLEEEPAAPRTARPERGISSALEAVVMRALAKDRGARFASAKELAKALREASGPALVIAPAHGADPALGASDTDLAIGRTLLSNEHVPKGDEATVRARPPVVEVAVIDAGASAGAHWGWILALVLASTAGVAIGVLFGSC